MLVRDAFEPCPCVPGCLVVPQAELQSLLDLCLCTLLITSTLAACVYSTVYQQM